MRWTWQSMAPAVRMRPLPDMISVRRTDDERRVDAVHRVGVAGLADADDAAVADADVGLDDAPVVEDHRAGDHEVGRALGAGRRRLAHRLADDLAAAEHGLVAAGAAVLGRPRSEVGVGEADAVAGRRAVERARYADRAGSTLDAVERSADLAAQAGDDRGRRRAAPAPTSVSMPGLEPHRRAGRHVEPHARVPRRGRTTAPGWPRRSGSASRPGSAGRRRSRPSASVTGRPALISIGPPSPAISPGIIGDRASRGSAGAA